MELSPATHRQTGPRESHRQSAAPFGNKLLVAKDARSVDVAIDDERGGQLTLRIELDGRGRIVSQTWKTDVANDEVTNSAFASNALFISTADHARHSIEMPTAPTAIAADQHMQYSRAVDQSMGDFVDAHSMGSWTSHGTSSFPHDADSNGSVPRPSTPSVAGNGHAAGAEQVATESDGQQHGQTPSLESEVTDGEAIDGFDADWASEQELSTESNVLIATVPPAIISQNAKSDRPLAQAVSGTEEVLVAAASTAGRSLATEENALEGSSWPVIGATAIAVCSAAGAIVLNKRAQRVLVHSEQSPRRRRKEFPSSLSPAAATG